MTPFAAWWGECNLTQDRKRKKSFFFLNKRETFWKFSNQSLKKMFFTKNDFQKPNKPGLLKKNFWNVCHLECQHQTNFFPTLKSKKVSVELTKTSNKHFYSCFCPTHVHPTFFWKFVNIVCKITKKKTFLFSELFSQFKMPTLMLQTLKLNWSLGSDDKRHVFGPKSGRCFWGCMIKYKVVDTGLKQVLAERICEALPNKNF